MKIQPLLESTDLETSEIQLKAYLLGGLCAENPAPAHKALEDILNDTAETRTALETPLKEYHAFLQKNLKAELKTMFPENRDVKAYLRTASDLIDEFLVGMSLAGTNSDACDDEDLLEFIELLDEYVAEIETELEDMKSSEADELKTDLLENWNLYVSEK